MGSLSLITTTATRRRLIFVPGETRCPRPRLMTSSASSRSMRTTASRPRRLSASLSPSRRRRRRNQHRLQRLLRLLQLRRRMTPRRRKRRRRRLPSKGLDLFCQDKRLCLSISYMMAPSVVFRYIMQGGLINNNVSCLSLLLHRNILFYTFYLLYYSFDKK